MLIPSLITALAALPIGLAAWLVHHKLTGTDRGRHRIALVEKPYRPHPPVRPPMPPVIPGNGPLTETETRARMVPIPVTPPAWRSDATETMPAAADPADSWDEAHRENWARNRVAAAGKDWATHMTKFSGAVVKRPALLAPEDRTFLEAVAAQPKVDGPDPFAVSPPATPDDWFGVPKDNTRKLERTQ